MTPAAGRLAPVGVAAVAIVAVALDQVSKTWALTSLSGRAPLHVVGSLQLALSFNSGVAFSLGQGSGLAVVPVAVVVVFVVVYVARKLPGRLAATSVGLVVGGAIGNLIDRAVAGSVTDFVKFPHFPAFNVADTAITFGVVALIYVLEGPSRRRGEAALDG